MYTIIKKIITVILTKEAQLVLKKYQPKIITVSGNVGKTSTKDAIYRVLKDDFYIRKSDKSYNSELGVPLTIIGRSTAWKNLLGWFLNITEGLFLVLTPHKYPDWLILEVGADRPKDIKKIASWLTPNIAVVTKIPEIPVHIEFFKSKEELIEEKTSIAKKVPADGVVIYNNDDPHLKNLKDEVKARVMTYGLNKGSTVRGSDFSILYKQSWTADIFSDKEGVPMGMKFNLVYEDKKMPVVINGALGFHHIYTALAACSVALAQKLDLEKAIERLGDFKTPNGRMRPIEGIKETIIIDDSYNSSPGALESALETLAIAKTKGKKIAVLGDMMELGEHTMEAHKKLGEIASSVCDELYLVGIRAKFFAEGALGAGFKKDHLHFYNHSTEAGKDLQNNLKAGDMILVKGSQSIRLEKVVEEIMAHPEKKEKLLCRQELEWQGR